MINKLFLAVFFLSVVFLVPTAAQTDAAAEKQAAVNELVALMNGGDRARSLVDAMTVQIQATRDSTVQALLNERTDLSVADRKAIQEMLAADRTNSVKRYTDKLMEKLDYSNLVVEVAYTVYDKYYTLEEIRELTTFYKSSVGQKSLEMMTPIMTDTMQLVQARLLPKIPEVFREIQEENRREIIQKIEARKPRPKRKRAA